MQRMKEMNTQNTLHECSASDVCPICHNTGWEMLEDGGQGTFIECKCGIRQRQIMENRLSFANIPESFEDARLDTFDIEFYEDAKSRGMAANAVKAIKFWLGNLEEMHEQGMGLYLYSATKGSGKTKMAVSIANELMQEKKMQVKFSTSLQILNEIKASWDKNESKYSESKLLDFLSTAEILIIDDFGTEQSDKSWINERFYHIINSRYIDRKVTIFTSNMSLKGLQYDERITNRIKERTFQVPFPEESIREIIARKNTEKLIKGIKGK